ncbi:hypothetical protein Tdes44962_MAKER07976 [Teratosphaeria destructans]|uniref:Uncharacterized protein n=1 Tax=Teratosphaeria destructans TaxID=418781 RepID=A0A9W7W5K2_9PEZI|nr:hypothetical protein Tdes44962_MAKER07976 [Teratosphaeria destructans]
MVVMIRQCFSTRVNPCPSIGRAACHPGHSRRAKPPRDAHYRATSTTSSVDGLRLRSSSLVPFTDYAIIITIITIVIIITTITITIIITIITIITITIITTIIAITIIAGLGAAFVRPLMTAAGTEPKK